MNPSSNPLINALIRAAYNAIGQAAAAAIIVWQTSSYGLLDKPVVAVFLGGILVALGFRGAVEGLVDKGNSQQRVADTAKAEERALTAGRKGTG